MNKSRAVHEGITHATKVREQRTDPYDIRAKSKKPKRRGSR